MKRNVVLIGFMGSGKTTYGKKLSKILNMDFLDTDRVIEEDEGMTVSEIFKTKGEFYFRQKEIHLVEEIHIKKNLVIATGGGIIKNEENVKLLKKDGIIVYLKASPEKIFFNLKSDKSRPLLMGTQDKFATIVEMLSQREELYKRHCDITFDVSLGSIEHITKCLVDSLEGVL